SFVPVVLFDLSFESLLRLTHAHAGEVSAVGHNSDANQIVVLRDIPEPALLRDKSDRGRAGIDPRIALGAFVVSPNGDFLEQRIFDSPAVADGGKRFFARTIQRQRGAIFDDLALLVAGANTGDPLTF